MKHKFLLAAGAVLASAAVSVFVYVQKGNNAMDEFFDANVEALAEAEDEYAARILYRFNRPDGFNCTKGGASNCL
ncbi:MAG: NVEALA domain-containing protein [Clostridium sp.]|nr:NVEALA domain-containing protein [Bacteroides sp.]MCM1198106.1 NVEALA domain-containing protein [Clostridium sp.]